VNVSNVALEGAFVDELALLQPTPGYMRLVKDRILHIWEQRCRIHLHPKSCGPASRATPKLDPPAVADQRPTSKPNSGRTITPGSAVAAIGWR
jgi:hypothetical protein